MVGGVGVGVPEVEERADRIDKKVKTLEPVPKQEAQGFGETVDIVVVYHSGLGVGP